MKAKPVSYTHLDVYKRQVENAEEILVEYQCGLHSASRSTTDQIFTQDRYRKRRMNTTYIYGIYITYIQTSDEHLTAFTVKGLHNSQHLRMLDDILSLGITKKLVLLMEVTQRNDTS